MAKTCCHQHEGGVAIREGAHHPSASPDLPQDALKGIVGPDTSPVGGREAVVGHCLRNAILHSLCRLLQPQGDQLLDYRISLVLGSLAVLGRMDGNRTLQEMLEQANLARDDAEPMASDDVLQILAQLHNAEVLRDGLPLTADFIIDSVYAALESNSRVAGASAPPITTA